MAASGKVAIVTGASRGIGRAVAERLARDGFRVAVHFQRARAEAQRVLESLSGEGHITVQADVADAAAVHTLVASVVERLGSIDLLINNAGIYHLHPIAEVDYEGWKRAWADTLAVNLTGPANLMFCALPHLLERGGGKIVNITSRGAFRGEPDAPAYGASKAGLNAAGQSLAKALAPKGIHVFTVAPGWVETDMAAEHLTGPGRRRGSQPEPAGPGGAARGDRQPGLVPGGRRFRVPDRLRHRHQRRLVPQVAAATASSVADDQDQAPQGHATGAAQ